MKWLKALTGGLAAAIALLAAGLALSIYFSWSGTGAMYTPENIGAKLHILVIPLLVWLVLLIVMAVLDLRTPQKPSFSPKPTYPALPHWVHPVALAAAAAAGIWILVYLANTSHFASRELETTVGAMVQNILPAAVVLLVSAYFLQKECSPKPDVSNAKLVLAVRVVLAALAVILIAGGVLNGGMRDVLIKATNICTECIGLG